MKVQTGVPQLDSVLNGGFVKGTLSLILADGDFSGKTTTLSYLADNAAKSGSRVAFASFDEESTELKQNLANPSIRSLVISPATFEEIQVELSSLSFQADILFIDNLNRLDYFSFNPEAVSVVHNLRLMAKVWNIAIVACVGIFPEHDVVPFLRVADNAFDVEEFQNKTFTLGVLKNAQGQAGVALNFGVSH